MKHATAFNCIRIWRAFGEMMAKKELYPDYFRLVRLLPIAKKDDKEEWLIKAVELPAKGFDDEIKSAKGLLTSDECDHLESDRVYYFRCKACRSWIKIDE